MSPVRHRKQSTESGRIFSRLDTYQKDAVRFALKARAAGLFFEQGTGKTWIAGAVIEQLLSPQFEGLLVGVLANKETTWEAFFAEHLPDLNVTTSWVIYKTLPLPRLLLVHYEALPKIVRFVRRRRFNLICVDESQRLKDRSSLTSRTLAKLRDQALYKIILSGTPMDEQPQDLWAQFRFLAPDLLGTRWQDFADEYFEPIDPPDLAKYRAGSMRWKRALRIHSIKSKKRKFDFDKLPDLIELIKPHALRVTKEVLNLKPMTVIEDPVTLRGLQREIYDEVADELFSERANVRAKMKVTQIGKLHQICGGYVINDDGDVVEVGRAKLRRVMYHARKIAKPFVIFCRYVEEVQEVAAAMRTIVQRVETFSGKTPKRDRPSIVRAFQAGEIDCLVCQIKTGGVGLDLFKATNAIFYSMTYSFIDFDQALSRIHRRGQEFPVTIIVVYAAGTIDETIWLAVSSKRKITASVLDKLKEEHGYGKGRKDLEVRHQRARHGNGHPARVRSRSAA